MRIAGLALLTAGVLLPVFARESRGDEPVPATELQAAVDSMGGAPSGEAAQDATTFEVTLRWQSRSLTDYWYRDPDAHGRNTHSVEIALEMEHPIGDDWRLWAQVDGWFDGRDTRWSSSQTDSIAFVAALRHDIGADLELEFGARFDDWVNVNQTKGDPWGPYAMVSTTFEALDGELCPYLYHELRNYIGGPRNDGTWISEAGVEYETPIGDEWTLGLAALGGRVDGSRTDPDVWALGGRAGVEWAWTETTSIGVWLEATYSAGSGVPNHTIGFVAVELKLHF